MKGLLAVLHHEFLLQRRQIQTVAMFLFLAIGAGPAGLIAVDRWNGVNERNASELSERPVEISADSIVSAWIQDADLLTLVEGPPTNDDTLEGTESYGHASLEEGTVTLRRPYSVTKSNQLRSRVLDLVRRENRARMDAAMTEAGRDPDSLKLTVKTVERDSTHADGSIAGRFLPGTLVFMLLSMALYAAVDVFTKEKEKGTAETLLTTAVDRRALLAGKSLIVFGLTVLAGSSWILSLALTERLGFLHVPTLFEAAVFTLPNVTALFLGMGLLAVLLSSLGILIAAWAESFRAASIASLPFLVVLMLPVLFASLPTTELTPFTACIPVCNLALVIHSVMAGSWAPGLVGLAISTSLLYAAGALGTAAWMLETEDPLDKGLDAESRRAMGDFGPDAFLVFTGAALGFYFFGVLAQTTHLLGGLAFSMGLLAVAAALGIAFFGPPWKRTLSWRLPTWQDALLGVGIGLTVRSIGTLAALAISPILTMPEMVVEGMTELTEQPVLLLLLVAAVGPGVCEELLFRGTIMGMLRTRYSIWLSVLLSSLMFGFLHTDLVRIVITTAIGLMLAVLVVRSRSLLPAMIAHTLNNGLIFIEGRLTDNEMVEVPVAAHVAIAMVCVGLVALAGRRRPPEGWDAAEHRH